MKKIPTAKITVNELKKYKGINESDDLILGEAKVFYTSDNQIVFENISTKEVVKYTPVKFFLEIGKQFHKAKQEFKKTQKTNKRRYIK